MKSQIAPAVTTMSATAVANQRNFSDKAVTSFFG
jgi:hypothetical protein